MKKILVLAATLLCLASCGDTSKVDDIIKEQNSSAETTPTAPPAAAAPTLDSSTPAADNAEPTLDDAKKLMENGDYDVDLTVLDSTLCYAQVFDMVNNPETYRGQSVRMQGNMAYFQDQNTGGEYFAVIIPDAAGCCAQGIEFKLAGDYKYPEDYPELGTVITVTGTFNDYEELGNQYIELVDANMTIG